MSAPGDVALRLMHHRRLARMDEPNDHEDAGRPHGGPERDLAPWSRRASSSTGSSTAKASSSRGAARSPPGASMTSTRCRPSISTTLAALAPELVIFGSGSRVALSEARAAAAADRAPDRLRDDGHRGRLPHLQRAARRRSRGRRGAAFRGAPSLIRVRRQGPGEGAAAPIICGYAWTVAQPNRILHDACPQQTHTGI